MKLKNLKLVEEFEVDSKMKSAIRDYKKFANLEESVKIVEIDEWALNEAAIKYNIPKRDLRHLVLGEDVTIDQAAREVEASKEEAHTKSQVEEALDEMLEQVEEMGALGSRSNFPSLLLEGEAGVGKTGIVESWIKENGFNYESLNLSSAKPEMFMGIIDRHPIVDIFVIRKISTELLVKFKKPNTVFFLDEYNRGDKRVRNIFLDLMLNHRLQVPLTGDDEKDKELYAPYGELQTGRDGNKMLFFPNLLFVVAAQNPYSHRYAGTNPLDSAEVGRMRVEYVETDPLVIKNYLIKKYKAQLENVTNEKIKQKIMGRIALTDKILSDPSFNFDSPREREDIYDENPTGKTTNPRDFEFLMNACDGTKASLLKLWDKFMSYKKKGLIQTILSDYVDVQDKANDALKGGSKSSVFAKAVSNSEKLFNAFPDLRA